MTTAETIDRIAPDGAEISRRFRVEGTLSRVTLLFCLCALVIVASLVLGGGTRGGFLSDAILQLLAIPLLLIALWRLLDVPFTKQMRVPLLFCLALVLIPIAQLIPLPPWLWTELPGRELSAQTFEILGQKPPWMPVSVSPYETWLSALSLIPPIAIFLATLMLPYRDRRWLTWVFLGVGVVSVFLGMIQVAQGSESPWRFFEITNESEAVGFFANRNHLAALLYVLTLFASAWAISATTLGQSEMRRNFDTLMVVAVIGAFTLLVVLLAGQMMARSRMGLGLTIAALFGLLALGASDRRVVSTVTPTRLVIGASILVAIFAAQFTLYRVLQRFAVDPLADYRLPFSRNTIEAALSYMPLGSGLGTFVPVYAIFEKPSDIIANTYANHAHNDFLELWLTTGVLGPTLVAMFIAWLGLRAGTIWRNAPAAGATELDWDLAKAATLVVGLLIVHSLVDYPLRTGAIMAVMGFACALLIEPPAGSNRPTAQLQPTKAPPHTAKRRLPDPVATTAEPTPVRETPVDPTTQDLVKTTQLAKRPKRASPIPPLAPQRLPAPVPSVSTEGTSLNPDQRWGADIDWPEEWSSSSEPSSGTSTGKTPKGSEPPGGS